MIFESLEEKCLAYRNLTDYKLLPNSYIIVMLDGRSFSKKVKNKFEKPFSKTFINMMNETAKYLCENISNAKLAFVQSDEISILISDKDKGDCFFKNRLCKIQSICASMATAKFNQLAYLNELKRSDKAEDIIAKSGLYQFDCKAWNVPTKNDVYAWFLYRQIDCVRNSKQQLVQTYISPKKLNNLTTDEQIALLKSERGIDWNDYSEGEKYGRFIYRIKTLYNNIELNKEYYRNNWTIANGKYITDEEGREWFENIEAIKSLA